MRNKKLLTLSTLITPSNSKRLEAACYCKKTGTKFDSKYGIINRALDMYFKTAKTHETK